MHGAGPALREPATELRAVETKLVAQHVQKRRVGPRGHAMALTVDGDLVRVRHGWGLYVAVRAEQPERAGPCLLRGEPMNPKSCEPSNPSGLGPACCEASL